jgi:DNA-binding NtrC family response regulator
VAHKEGRSASDLEHALKSFGFPVTLVSSLKSMRERLVGSDHAVLMLDADLAQPELSPILNEITSRQIDLAVVLITDSPSMKSVLEAMRGGACDYLTEPYRLDQLDHCVQRALAVHERFSRRAAAATTV